MRRQRRRGYINEGKHDYMYELDTNGPLSERTRLGTMSDFFRGGYTYAESKVVRKRTGKYFEYQPIPPVYYRCTPLPKNPQVPAHEGTNCIVIDQPMSRYMVKASTIKIGTAEVFLDKIINRSTHKLMAESRSARLTFSFPFFGWLCKPDGPPPSISCSKWRKPKGVYYHPFEFDVLKPAK